MSILVLAEHDGQQLKQATRQVVTAAQAWGAPVRVLVVGHEAEAIAQAAAALQGVAEVLLADAPQFAHPLAEDVAALLQEIGASYTAIVGPHTSFARNVLPRAAALLDVAMISDVIRIEAPATYVRPFYTGSALATLQSSDPIQVLTVRASSFEAAAEGAAAPVTRLPAPAPTQAVRFVSENRAVSNRPELATARIIISGGRPLGEQFEAVLGPLASKLGAALGATRAAVDAGFAPNEIQVGSTGTTVAPELYVAIAVSGAAQHLAGMKDSKVIVAINKDPDAPIFQVADFGLVADLFEAVPALNTALE